MSNIVPYPLRNPEPSPSSRQLKCPEPPPNLPPSNASTIDDDEDDDDDVDVEEMLANSAKTGVSDEDGEDHDTENDDYDEDDRDVTPPSAAQRNCRQGIFCQKSEAGFIC